MARNVRIGDVVRVPWAELPRGEDDDQCPETARVVDIRGEGLLTLEDDDGVRWIVPREDVVIVWARGREGVSNGA
jgi:hypothetical protein